MILNREAKNRCTYIYNECLKKDILNGRLPANKKLPSKRELAKDNCVSVRTVMNAYDQLLVEGYIFSQEKRGYFVAKDIEVSPEYQPVLNEYPVLYREESWFADFTSNNTIYERFPFTQWRKSMRDVLSAYDFELVQRAHFQGIRELREAIADYLFRVRGMQVSPDYIIIGSGIEYLYSRLMKILPSEAIYAAESPGYKKIRSFTKNRVFRGHTQR